MAPKFVPVMVTVDPTGPWGMLRVEMVGAELTTVKVTPLLGTPPTVTTTLPVVAPVGTGMEMLVAVQVVAVPAEVPLKVTVLVPCVDPKFEPLIVTEEPTGAEVGFKVVMAGPVPPAPIAALKAASPAPHLSETLSEAVAEAVPAADCT